MPDGTLDLVFNLGSTVSLSRDGTAFTDMPAVSLTGLYPDRSFLRYHYNVHLVGVVFQPGAAHLFVKDNLENIKASTIDASAVFGKELFRLQEQLRDFRSEVLRHRLLEQYLVNRITGNNICYQEQILDAVQEVQAAQGNLDIGSLHSRLLMSERNFRRKFVEYVGMNPKQYAGIIRIKSFSKQYKDCCKDVLYSLGYSDPSHFNKEFHKIAGTSPNNYFKQLDGIAGEFIHLI